MLFMRPVWIHLAHISDQSRATVQSASHRIEKEVAMCASATFKRYGAEDVIGFDAFAHKLFPDNTQSTVNIPE